MDRTKFIVTLLLVALLLVALPSSGQKKYALLVGISNYHAQLKHTEWNNIHGANDVNLIAPLLAGQGFKVYKILDRAATKGHIIRNMKALSKEVRPGSIVYLHFSCHGQPFEDLNGDEADGWDESIVPVNAPISYSKGHYEGQNHIIDDELNKLTEQIRKKIGSKGHLYVVIDACHAGRASRNLDDMEITRGTKRGFSPHGKRYRAKREKPTHYRLAASHGESDVTYLEACGNTQVNMEIKRGGRYYGPMSFYIAKVISTHKITADNKWVYQVQQLMRKDIDVQNQDMVIESTK